jgi:hypothetical protein
VNRDKGGGRPSPRQQHKPEHGISNAFDAK